MLNKIAMNTSLLCIGVLYVILASINLPSLMNGTQSGKTVIFLCFILLFGCISLLRSIWGKANPPNITIIDLILAAWLFYIPLNGWLKQIPVSSRFLELMGLALLYFFLRQIPVKYFSLLFLALILGGFIQAVFGNLQLWGYYPSHHNLFKMTGSFFNPGPYAGYLASILPITLGIYLYKIHLLQIALFKHSRFRQKVQSFLVLLSLRAKTIIPSFIIKATGQFPLTEKQNGNSRTKVFPFVETFSLLSLVLMTLVLPASRSRTAWLAVLVSSSYLLIVRYKAETRAFLDTFLNSAVKKTAVLVLSVILAGGMVAGLYHFKRGSADGRMLIWKVTGEMIKEHPVTGVGFDQFKAHYMDYQARFFEENPQSEAAMVAGDSNYAFNELLQQTAENGIIGLVLMIIALIIIFAPLSNHPLTFSHPQTFKREASNVKHQARSIKHELPNIFKPNEDDDEKRPLTIIAKAGIISIFIFSLFSYPAQILPIKVNLVLFLALVSHCSPRMNIPRINVFNKKPTPLTTYSLKFIGTSCLFFLAYRGITYIDNYKDAHRNWNHAYQLYQLGAYEACLEDYELAYPALKNNGDFLTNYGKALSMAEKHAEAVSVLQQAAKHYPNTVVYTALGNTYKTLKEVEKVEEAYLHAWHMNPSRFYPKYLLAKLYDESGQNDKAVSVAKELLDKEIKIESTAIEEIKEEMRKIIENSAPVILNKSNTQTDNNFVSVDMETKWCDSQRLCR
jgi:O-antigen ligase/tetratricopeptide (TPR) repeat protein